MRLQPRAVGPLGVARGRGADEGSRGRVRHARGVLVGMARARTRRVRLRAVRRGPRAAARERDRRRPGHGHRLAAAVAHDAAPGGAAGRRRGAHTVAGQPAVLVSELPGVPRPRAPARRRARPPVRQPPGREAVARQQRAGVPRRQVLLRRERRGVPALARGPLRLDREAERRVGHGVLVAALLLVRRGAAAPAHAHDHQSEPRARLLPLLVRRAAGLLPRGARRPAPALAGRARHHEPDGQPAAVGHRLLQLGAAARPRLAGPLHRHPAAPPPGRAGVQRRPHAGRGGRRAVDAHGVGHERGELAAGEPGEEAG